MLLRFTAYFASSFDLANISRCGYVMCAAKETQKEHWNLHVLYIEKRKRVCGTLPGTQQTHTYIYIYICAATQILKGGYI